MSVSISSSELEYEISIVNILDYLRERLIKIVREILELEDSAVIALDGKSNPQRAKDLRQEGLRLDRLIVAYEAALMPKK